MKGREREEKWEEMVRREGRGIEGKGAGLPWGSQWVLVWGRYGDDLPSPQTHGDSMGIFNQPEITR